MDRRRRTTAGLVLLATAALGVAPSYAADGDGGTANVSATLTAGSIGSRSVTTVSPVALTTALGTSTLSGALATTVTEAARTGSNNWSVTAAIGTLTHAVDGTKTLANTNLSIDNRDVLQVAGGGTAAEVTGSQTMDAARTLFTTPGQSTTAVYTGTYAATADITLAVPNGTTVGVYNGTLTVTLVQ